MNAKNTSGKLDPYWIDSAASLKFKKLNQDIENEILVVGGGITGLTAAYLLAKAGKDVVVVDDGLFCSGETGRTTAHLSWVLDDTYHDLEKMHGKDKVKCVLESHLSAIKLIEKTISDEKIECGFKKVDGFLFFRTRRGS